MFLIQKINKIPIWLFFILLLTNSSASFALNLRSQYESAVDAYNQGQYDRSIELYQSIIKEMPSFAPAYIGVGLSLKAKGADFNEVLYYYKMAVDNDPRNVQAFDQLGRLYYANGQLDKAKDVFEKAIKIDPNMPQVKMALGWIYLTGRNVNPAQSIYYFEDVVKTNPTPNAYFALGMAYFSNNQRSKTMDVITQLKGMGQDDLANKLEKAMRNNQKVVLNNPEDQQEVQESVFENTADSLKGIKVRLKGRLDQL